MIQFMDIAMPHYLHELTDLQIQKRLQGLLEEHKRQTRGDYLSSSGLKKVASDRPPFGGTTQADEIADLNLSLTSDLEEALYERDERVLDHHAYQGLADIGVEAVAFEDEAHRAQFLRYRELLIQTRIEQLKYTAGIYNRTEPAVEPVIPLSHSVSPASVVPVIGGFPLLSRVIEEFISYKLGKDWASSNASKKNAPEYRAVANDLMELFGDKPFDQYSRKEGRVYQDLLINRYPSYRNSRKDCRSRPLIEFLDLDVPVEYRLSDQTIKKKLVALNAVFKHAYLEYELPTKMPFEGISHKVKDKAERLNYDKGQLALLFLSSDYCTNSHKELWQYWLPLLALFTGARQSEIVQLRVKDVSTIDEVNCLSVANSEIVGGSQKSKNAERVVPIHSELVRLGFLDYLAWLVSQGLEENDSLFPDLILPSVTFDDGVVVYSSVVSRWYNRNEEASQSRGYKLRCGVHAESKKFMLDWHSFRTTFISALMIVEAPVHKMQTVVGHEKGLTESSTYTKFPPSVTRLVVEMVGTYGLDLSPLYGGWEAYKDKLLTHIDKARKASP